jgi:hypothetical protein
MEIEQRERERVEEKEQERYIGARDISHKLISGCHRLRALSLSLSLSTMETYNGIEDQYSLSLTC